MISSKRNANESYVDDHDLPQVDDFTVAASFALIPIVVVASSIQQSEQMKDDNEVDIDDIDTIDHMDSHIDINTVQIHDEKKPEHIKDNPHDDKSLSSSDNDDDDDDVNLSNALAQMQDDEEDDDPSIPKTLHEVIESTEISPLILTIPEQELICNNNNNNMKVAGHIKTTMHDGTVIIESTPDIVLEEGTLVLMQQTQYDNQWIPLGRILEVFGPIRRPLYTIRVTLSLLPTTSTMVFYIQPYAKMVNTYDIIRASGKGCDASNLHDEEVMHAHELYFSDDEQERMVKQQHKRGHKKQVTTNQNHSAMNQNHSVMNHNHAAMLPSGFHAPPQPNMVYPTPQPNMVYPTMTTNHIPRQYQSTLFQYPTAPMPCYPSGYWNTAQPPPPPPPPRPPMDESDTVYYNN
jgi:rRNA processing protein Gar1